MFYTSYFAKLNKIPQGYIPIAICAKKPDFYNGLIYKRLAPPYDILMKYKQDNNIKDYLVGYNDKVLHQLNPDVIASELRELAGGAENIVLLCYEKSDSFCHRHIVANWFNNNGIKCEELKV